VEQARCIRVEDEIAHRRIKLRGTVDRCGPCPRCGGTDRFAINVAINVRKQCFIWRGAAAGDVIAMCSFVTAVETLTGDEFRRPMTPPPEKAKREGEAYGRERHRKAARYWQRR
jgi:hypothetical protein